MAALVGGGVLLITQILKHPIVADPKSGNETATEAESQSLVGVDPKSEDETGEEAESQSLVGVDPKSGNETGTEADVISKDDSTAGGMGSKAFEILPDLV